MALDKHGKKAGTKAVKPSKIVDLDALTLGSQAIAFQRSQCSVNEHRDVVDKVGAMLDEGTSKVEQGAGGRSDSSFPPAKVTAKPLPLLSCPSSSLIPDHNGDETVNPTPNPADNLPSDMPVLGVPMGVHRKEDPKVVQTCHVGGIHSKTGPILGHKESNLVTTSLNVPYSPDVEEPMGTEEVRYGSPFITGNERIDRRTAFTQYCRLGEGRTYMKVAGIMAVPLESIKEWAKGDNWENAYRERVTADIVQVAKEENIHEVLDIRREVIAQLKQRIQDSKNGKEVFKSTKELLDTMLKLEELTGASTANTVRPGQIFVIISSEEWQAREKLNEQARLEESKA